MIDGIVHWWRIGRLQKSARKSRAYYAEKIKAEKDRHKRESLEQDAMHDEGEVVDEIEQRQHRHLADMAERYLIALPDFDRSEEGAWEKSRYTGRWRLKLAELHKLRSVIRAERKEWFDAWFRWVALVASVVSLGISIAAYIKK